MASLDEHMNGCFIPSPPRASELFFPHSFDAARHCNLIFSHRLGPSIQPLPPGSARAQRGARSGVARASASGRCVCVCVLGGQSRAAGTMRRKTKTVCKSGALRIRCRPLCRRGQPLPLQALPGIDFCWPRLVRGNRNNRATPAVLRGHPLTFPLTRLRGWKMSFPGYSRAGRLEMGALMTRQGPEIRTTRPPSLATMLARPARSGHRESVEGAWRMARGGCQAGTARPSVGEAHG